MRERLSPNFDARPAGEPIDTLILHYTGMQSGKAALDRLCDPEARVSSHYVIEEDGQIWRLVPEEKRAFHAGVSFWRGNRQLNGRSIGIEIVNPGHDWGYRDFPALQMAAVAELCLDILGRHPIPARNVVAHSDIAPDRKQDPGELFDWEGLAGQGIGVWADVPGDDVSPGDPAQAAALLARIGYPVEPPLDVLVTAFQRHWRPERVDGRVDRGTLARMAALV